MNLAKRIISFVIDFREKGHLDSCKNGIDSLVVKILNFDWFVLHDVIGQNYYIREMLLITINC